MKRIYHVLFVLHLFVGIGAMSGGAAAILNPQAPFGMPLEALKKSPFSNYLIPGIILFVIIGVGNITGALGIYLKSRFEGYISSVFGCALVIWIVVQCVMLNAVVLLHIIFFVIGLIQAILALTILTKQRLFPVNFIFDAYRQMKAPSNKKNL